VLGRRLVVEQRRRPRGIEPALHSAGEGPVPGPKMRAERIGLRPARRSAISGAESRGQSYRGLNRPQSIELPDNADRSAAGLPRQ
jgi:hypothetical protein